MRSNLYILKLIRSLETLANELIMQMFEGKTASQKRHENSTQATAHRERAASRHGRAAWHSLTMESGLLSIVLAGLLIATTGGIASAAGKFKLNSLKGRFVAAGTANDASITGTASEPNPPTVPFAAAGFLNFDGKGNIASGEETINYGSPGTGDSFTCSLTGTYTIDSTTGRVILMVTVTAGPAVTSSESTSSNGAQCGGTGTWVGYLDKPNGRELYTIEQTNTGGTPTPPAATTTPILSAHVWSSN
jgi:hypothetical protein